MSAGFDAGRRIDQHEALDSLGMLGHENETTLTRDQFGSFEPEGVEHTRQLLVDACLTLADGHVE